MAPCYFKYSLLFNTSHGILIREKWDFPPNPFIPAWSLSKSLLCLLLHPGLKPFLFTWKQWWCHCYINRGLLCSVFQPGLWVNGMACLVIQTCFWKKSGMSPNTTWLVLKRKEYTNLGTFKIEQLFLQCQEGIYLYKLLYTEEMQETHTFILQIRRESIIM